MSIKSFRFIQMLDDDWMIDETQRLNALFNPLHYDRYFVLLDLSWISMYKDIELLPPPELILETIGTTNASVSSIYDELFNIVECSLEFGCCKSTYDSNRYSLVSRYYDPELISQVTIEMMSALSESLSRTIGGNIEDYYMLGWRNFNDDYKTISGFFNVYVLKDDN